MPRRMAQSRIANSTTVPLTVLEPVAVEPIARYVDHDAAGLPTEFFVLTPRMMAEDGGFGFTVHLPNRLFGDYARNSSGALDGTILENNQILGPPATSHSYVRKRGRGQFSVWSQPDRNRVVLFFSSSDNTDPRTNGRTYVFVNRSLDFANDWKHLATRSWLNHSRGRYFLKRGGRETPPPQYANMGITDICNLKCGICGSQNMCQPVNRRHMDFHIFEQVAATLFPLLTTVELNSRGEPLLHPRIPEMLETIADFGIFLRLQTNGTQFFGSRLTNLLKLTGEISVSIDATGEVFEYARTNAKWPQVDEGIRNLMKRRDPDRLAVYVYPTLTETTIKDARNLIRWGMETGIDRIDFHQYDPIYGGSEVKPSTESINDLKRFASKVDPKHPIEIRVCYEVIKPGDVPIIPHPPQELYPNIPRKASLEGANPEYTCMAPHQLVDIDLDGGICVCCMLQDRKLGNALTVEAFADCWFGAEYQAIRKQMRRGPDQYALYEKCRNCIANYTK